MKKSLKCRFWQRLMAAMLYAVLVVGITDGTAQGIVFAQENADIQVTAGKNAAVRVSDDSETWSGDIAGQTISSRTLRLLM